MSPIWKKFGVLLQRKIKKFRQLKNKEQPLCDKKKTFFFILDRHGFYLSPDNGFFLFDNGCFLVVPNNSYSLYVVAVFSTISRQRLFFLLHVNGPFSIPVQTTAVLILPINRLVLFFSQLKVGFSFKQTPAADYFTSDKDSILIFFQTIATLILSRMFSFSTRTKAVLCGHIRCFICNPQTTARFFLVFLR